MLFQPKDSVGSYHFVFAAKPTNTITVNGKSYAGGEFVLNENVPKTVHISGISNASFVIQEGNADNQESESHLSKSGYSSDEFAALLKVAESYASIVAANEKLGIPQYTGELFDLDAVKGTVSFNFNLDGANTQLFLWM